MTVPSTQNKLKHISRRDRFLVVILAVLVVVWLITWPLRSRLSRDTARIESETALQAEALKSAVQLRTQEAEARKRIRVNPRDFDARLQLASTLSQQRKYSEALENVKLAQQIDPRSARPHAAMGQIFDAGGLTDLAIDELRKAVAIDPADTTSMSLLAYKYVAAGWNREAEALLTQALQKQPDNVRLHVTLALVEFQNDQTASAEQHLVTARRLAPQDPTVAAPLVEVYRHAQRYAEALRIIDEMMPTLPEKQTLLLEKAQIYQEMERPDDAIRTADEILRMSPGVLKALYIRGVSYKMKGDTTAALRDLEQVRAGEARMEQTLLLLGQLYKQQGQTEKGNALLAEYNRNQAIGDTLVRLGLRVSAQPNDWKGHFDLGAYYLRGGSNARAIVELKRAIELKPGQNEARNLLVQALRAAHRDEEANALSKNGNSS